MSPDEYPSEYQAWRSERLRDPDRALHGGESPTALRQRAMEAVSRAHEAAQQGVALIVSHRVFIGAVAANLNGACSPQNTFQAARDFGLGPAMVWPACPYTDSRASSLEMMNSFSASGLRSTAGSLSIVTRSRW
ncbi:histidine phosphatase family protein [Micromonospora inyonensis]|uniref:histidine phosphatase family protein n=1 Tax=Micromonospora inyonensis TaxID=47866 RepID=UPI00114C91B4